MTPFDDHQRRIAAALISRATKNPYQIPSKPPSPEEPVRSTIELQRETNHRLGVIENLLKAILDAVRVGNGH
jgi:hypothetical protein